MLFVHKRFLLDILVCEIARCLAVENCSYIIGQVAASAPSTSPGSDVGHICGR
jgi:hypothetical protein